MFLKIGSSPYPNLDQVILYTYFLKILFLVVVKQLNFFQNDIF